MINLDRDVLDTPPHWEPEPVFVAADGTVVRKQLVPSGYRRNGRTYVDRELAVRWASWRPGRDRYTRAAWFRSWREAREVLGRLERFRRAHAPLDDDPCPR